MLVRGHFRGLLLAVWLGASAPACAQSIVQGGDRLYRISPSRVIALGNRHDLSEITALAATDSTFAVADRLSQEILVFDTLGRLIGRVGGKGDGPGQFRDVRRLGLNDSVVVSYDNRSLRLASMVFRRGATVNDVRLEGVRGGIRFQNAGPIRFIGADTVAMGISIPLTRPTQDLAFGEAVRVTTFGGATIRTVPVPVAPEVAWFYDKRDGTKGNLFFPYSPWSVWGLGPNGRFGTAWGGKYEVLLHRQDGSLESSVRRSVSPVPVQAEEEQYVRSSINRLFDLTQASPSAYARPIVNDGMFVTSIVFGSGRDLFVGRSMNRRSPVFDFFRNGEFQCAIELDVGGYWGAYYFVPLVVAGTTGFLVARDEVDVPVVTVFDLRAPCRAN